MSHNTWIHRIIRVGVRPLTKTPVTPNQLTTLRIVAGVIAAAFFAVGAPPWQHYGAAVFVLSMLLDRADGELARLSGKTSEWGHAYDLISDAVSYSFVFIGIGIGLRDSIFGLWSIPMGFVAGVSVALVFWLVSRMEALEGQRAGEFEGAAGFDPDDAVLAVPLAMAFGWGELLLVAAAIGAPAFLLFAYLRFQPRLRRQS